MHDLSLKQKIGQRMIVGFTGTAIPEDFVNLVKECKVGNVILFKDNLVSCEQTAKICSDIRKLIFDETGIYPFITIDQEGGVVSRLSEDASNIPGAMAIAATDNPENAYAAGLITGRELKALGINFNLAPDVDINSNINNPVIGVRSYGDTPDTVIKYSIPMIKGLLDAGVAAAAKHFPGHGDTSVDSHLDLPVVDKPLSELEQNELKPFKAAVDAGIPAIMSSHIYFRQLINKKLPATMSREIITDLLRNKLGFKGLIISDCMEMKAIQKHYGTPAGVVGAFKAGVDMVFISHTVTTAIESCKAIARAMANGEINLTEMDESVKRILLLKEKYANPSKINLELVGCKEHKQIVRDIMEKTITCVNLPQSGQQDLGSKPLFVSCRDYRATQVSSVPTDIIAFSEYLAQKLNGEAIVTSDDPDEREINEIVSKVRDYTAIVIGTYNGHIKTGQLRLVNELKIKKAPMIVVALRNPYDLRSLDKNIYTLAAYEYTKLSMDAVIEILSKHKTPTGKLSVRL